MSSSEKYLNFLVGNECFAIPLLKVREVIGMPDITPVPQAPANVIGIINLRGQIITIFDLRTRLGVGVKGEQPTVIICEMSFGQMGMVVDSVANVISAAAEKISEVPAGSRAANHDFVTNIYTQGEELVLMLDVEKVIGKDIKTPQGASAA